MSDSWAIGLLREIMKNSSKGMDVSPPIAFHIIYPLNKSLHLSVVEGVTTDPKSNTGNGIHGEHTIYLFHLK